MKKTFIKISLTLCALLLISVPAQAFAAEKTADTSKCNLKTLVNQEQLQQQLQDATSKLNLNGKIGDLAKGTNCPLTNAKATNDVTKDVKGVTTTGNKNCTVNKCDSVKNCAVNKCENNKNCKVNNCNDKNKACKIVAEKSKTTCPLQNKTANNSNNKATKPVDNNASTKPSTTTPATTKPSTTAPSTTAPTTTKPSTTTDTNASISSYEQQVANIVNKERAANGLPALKVNANLSAVAEKKAEDMRDKNYFSHTSPTYGSPFDMMKQFGISYRSAGENIAKGQRTPEEVMTGWMNSPGHRANILNADFTEIGIGYVTDSNGNTYWVQQFIRP